MPDDIYKEDIPREFVNPTLIPEKVSIWGIVQLVGHGAVDFTLMPEEIRDRVEAEIHRRHLALEEKLKVSNV